MHIDRMSIHNNAPIKEFAIETPSNVVIIAGANGSGKTRLKEAIVQTFRKPNAPRMSMTLSCTRSQEEEAWGARHIEVKAGEPAPTLAAYLATRTRGQAYVGAAVQIDSDRAVQPVKFETFTLATTDPEDDEFTYSLYLSPFVSRWQTLVNNIYKRVANRDQRIAKFVHQNPEALGRTALDSNPDPFLPFQEMFARLLPGKTLEPIDPKAPREFRYRASGSTNETLDFTTLSSGEKEVIRVAFDLVWKKITHSVILVDEPELHLHPTLTFRLIETLKGFGSGTNQLILFTHSADLISTYYSTGNVFFVDTTSTTNQAQQLSALNKQHSTVARAAGANLGLFAVGRKLVFVEGRDASVDRLVYHRVAQRVFPDAYVMPLGSVENLLSLRAVVEELSQAVFGLELFMVRDRDGLTSSVVASLEQNQRFRCLPRRHVENYLLDPTVLASVARQFYLAPPLFDAEFLQKELQRLAEESLMTAVLWNVREHIRAHGAVAQPKIRKAEQLTATGLAEALSSELSSCVEEMSSTLNAATIARVVNDEHAILTTALSDGTWRAALPGKLIFGRFCGEIFGVETARVREAYVDTALKEGSNTFHEIEGLLRHFASSCITPA
jgi:predicted ATPase